jgi:hypothetical protein
MPILKSLSLTALPKSTNDPVQQRRTKFITKLEEQKLLLNDPNHVRTVPIEFEKGKAGIVVPSRDKLPTVIDTLIAAVRAGELDELFNQAAKTGAIGKARKAA